MDSRLNTRRQQQHQRGFSLMEILVAVAIFATVMVVALLLYDRSNRVFKEANESAAMQQNTRVAFEKVAADLRMAGFDYKRAGTPTATTPAEWEPNRAYSVGTLVTPSAPNGHVYRCIDAGTSGGGEPTWTTGKGDIIPDKAPVRWQEGGAPVYEQPDEQIEYAHSAAVTLRANFDYDEPNTDNGREAAYENSTLGSFPVVTTGNDEIVTYALRSTTGSNPNTIEFYADVNDAGTSPSRSAYPGGKIERLIKITKVDLGNANPPYTLYRFTLSDKGEVVETALADGIRSMTFNYWEDAQATRPLTDLNNVAAPDVGGLGAYDPDDENVQASERIIRSKIRAVTMNIVGMSPVDDPNYLHPTDTVAKNYRQYQLNTTVVGRNLGMEGVPQFTNSPPGPPTLTSSCNGYCGITVLSWKPDSATVGAQSYTILYDKSSSGSFSGVLPAGTQTSYAVDLTQLLPEATTYFFKVAATNENGTTVSKNTLEVDVRNITKPSPPAIAAVAQSTGKPGELVVSWTAPTSNASGAPSCTAGSPPASAYAAEVKGYRVYRSMTDGFKPGETGVVELMTENTGGATTDGSGVWSFLDNTVAACEKYYYRVVAVEWCSAKPAYNTTGQVATGESDAAPQFAGMAIPVTKPRAPQNLKVHEDSTCDPVSNKCFPIILTWDKVTQDLSNNPIVVLDYEISRQQKLLGVPKGSPVTFDISDGTTSFSESGSLEYMDPILSVKYSYEYSIRAVHGYGSGDTGCNLKSDPTKISFPDSCSTSASVKADASNGTGTSGDPWLDVSALQVIEGAKPITSVEVRLDNGAFATLAYPYQYGYTDTEDGAVHSVEFRVVAGGCTEQFTVYVQNDSPSCLLSGTVVSNSASTAALDIDLRSAASETITILGIDVTWAGQSGMAWNSVTLPSGATSLATGTAASPRKVTFTPAAGDRTITANGSYKIKMNFTGTPVALGSSVSAVTVRYTVPSTGATPHNCAVSIVRCFVSATVTATNSNTIQISVINNSTEALDIQSFSIRWLNQNKLDWATTTLPSGTTVNVVSSQNGGTEVISPAIPNKTINAGQTYTVNMHFTSTFNNPPNVNPANVAAVQFNYRTPASGTVTLGCRVD